MWEAEIVTPWIGAGIDNDPNRPQLGDDYAIKRWEDTTGQLSANLHPDPSIYIVKVLVEAAVLDAIEADNNYQVLWAEEVVDAPI
ncbi:hypothetical protein LCGC14_1974480 [marine sediment metagenome]|uniref:Uncharacterized protein n=1 Tax=marine sediment metagenome TaxID=412755 RepID=A0A0F9HP51_9ZZZZ